MGKETIVLTRKIQLLIDIPDRQAAKEKIHQLYKWQSICFRAANMIMSHHFVQEQVKDFLYLTEGAMAKIADIKKDPEGILRSSRQNTTYRVLSDHFKGQIPTNILSYLNNNLITYFNTDKVSYWKGEKSLRNYKRTIPIPFGAEVLYHLRPSANNRDFCFTLFQIPFRTYLGKDRDDKRMMLSKVMNGKLKLRASKIQLDNGKVYLLACIEVDRDQHQLDRSIIAEASHSMEHPVTVKIGNIKYVIGNREEFLHRRLAIQSALHRLKAAVKYNQGGHGRKKKERSLEEYRHREKKYIESKLHLYSRMLIDYCVKHRAATLLLVNQEMKEEVAKQDAFLLKNWSYNSLKEKIAYKAAKAGIQLIVE